MIEINESYVKNLLKIRDKNTYKWTYGTLIAVSGSYGMAGAATFVCKAALKSGCGIIRCISDKKIDNILQILTPETIHINVESSEDTIREVLHFAKSSNAITIGSGLGQSEDTAKIIKFLLKNLPLPIVLDADGLNNISCEDLKNNKGLRLITPHYGEAARLISVNKTEIMKSPEKFAKIISEKTESYVLLKGHTTYIASFDGKMAFHEGGNPGMATPGSGDVLTGIVLSFVGQGLNPFDALSAAAYVHAKAGDLAAKNMGEYGLIASDIIENIPYAIKNIVGK